MALKRQISENEKKQVLENQGMRCFIDNHPLDVEAGVEFDHIDPYSQGGESEISNVGVVCKKHNRDKGALTLSEYRDRLGIRAFFEGAKKRKLDDLLTERLGRDGFGHPAPFEVDGTRVTVHADGGPIETQLALDPATEESYFFAMLPVSNLKNDLELQPRSLEAQRVWELYRHLVRHTQLAPAVCRTEGSQILLFDGQHKAAAQVWAGRDFVDCKVYVEPELRRMKETNLAAHDRLRQMPFYTSTLIEKFAALASEDWEEFLRSDKAKTEAAFVEFMRSTHEMTKAEAVKRVRSMIYRDIIDHPDNTLRDYIAEENRARKNPITMSRLQKTFLKEFVADPPLNDEFETDDHFRSEERDNLVRFFNIIVALGLEDRWAPERKDSDHAKAARIFSAGALRAWVPFLRDALAPSFQLYDQADRGRIFYRDLDKKDFEVAEQLVGRVFSHKVWVDPDPALNDLRYDNVERAQGILRDAGLAPNWILGGEE